MGYSATLPSDIITRLGDIAEIINGSQRFLITAHLRPDGDATGSVLGLARALRLAGKQADITLHDPIPERFRFLLGEELILRPDQLQSGYDTVLVLDSGDADRTG
ncbi:MAG TPA: bifunctional oligoribonuclease/PAP phosphatase NrnA, partial [Candidatus Ozemobacteraceae bacterium]|nr:bifunctional oligoribonuclease/PAP phosphatase NrnA [Candidatus Ozemobacteraceae bacterium]